MPDSYILCFHHVDSSYTTGADTNKHFVKAVKGPRTSGSLGAKDRTLQLPLSSGYWTFVVHDSVHLPWIPRSSPQGEQVLCSRTQNAF